MDRSKRVITKLSMFVSRMYRQNLDTLLFSVKKKTRSNATTARAKQSHSMQYLLRYGAAQEEYNSSARLSVYRRHCGHDGTYFRHTCVIVFVELQYIKRSIFEVGSTTATTFLRLPWFTCGWLIALRRYRAHTDHN